MYEIESILLSKALIYRYDLTIGTSDRGESVDSFACPAFEHLLIVFGGLQGLEDHLQNDEALEVDDPQLLFDHYLNTVPNQGSRTVRTEEAVLITMGALRAKLNPKWKPVDFTLHDQIACSNEGAF